MKIYIKIILKIKINRIGTALKIRNLQIIIKFKKYFILKKYRINLELNIGDSNHSFLKKQTNQIKTV